MQNGFRSGSGHHLPSPWGAGPGMAWRWVMVVSLVVGWSLAAAAVDARAATERPEEPLTLAGITRATLGASQLTPDGAVCGLDLDHLTRALHDPLTDAGLVLREDTKVRITVSAVTGQLPDSQCATAVMLGVYARESFFSTAVGWLRSGHVVLWQRSIMVVTPRIGHKPAVEDAARRLAVRMIGDWREMNAGVVVGTAETTPKTAR